MRHGIAAVAAGIGIAVAVASGPRADTLTDTLIQTYQDSPILDAQRAALRTDDEGVAQARSARRPTLDASVSADASAEEEADWEVRDQLTAALRSTLLLYDHGATAAAIASAEAQVEAARAQLRGVEQQVLLRAVAAYVTVRRDIQAVSVSRNNTDVLQEQLRATRDRFELGEVTRTDVSLAEARLAEAQARLARAQGDLQASREEFTAVVGRPAQDLQSPPPLPPLADSLEAAQAIALRQHPDLAAARAREEAARFDVARARGRAGPRIDAEASINSTLTENPLADDRIANQQARVGITGTVPLYRGGEISSLIRQARAVLQQTRFQLQDTGRQIRQDVATAWSDLSVARATISANREQVRAARIAFDGVQEEAQLGARTTLDVLDIEQDLRDAELALADSLRDEYVAAYRLLAAMGLLNVDHLELGIAAYDPQLYYARVRGAPYSTVEGDILEQLRDRYGR